MTRRQRRRAQIASAARRMDLALIDIAAARTELDCAVDSLTRAIDTREDPPR